VEKSQSEAKRFAAIRGDLRLSPRPPKKIGKSCRWFSSEQVQYNIFKANTLRLFVLVSVYLLG